ncbi:MAG: biotin transporter BioY [Caldimicrobium sp.]|nr:biotin transporter BioY [Caldimicrobium sp.]MCX7874430.1 biotin transporter BioY [Caldimicrobium sp.]MDW8093985.1 biotin transporter BioY [Caldimicrobium sp.]
MIFKEEFLSVKKAWVESLLYVVSFAFFLALLSQIRIPLPFTPVPLTLQTLGILFIGYYLGAKLGIISVLTYLTLGASGLPFFAGLKGGMLILSGPTGGYLLGFLAGVYLVGKAKELGWLNRWSQSLMVALLCHLLIYFFGLIWFWVGFSKFNSSLALRDLLVLTVIPFLPTDLLKSVIFVSFLSLHRKFRGQ